MNIKLSIAGIIIASSLLATAGLSQARTTHIYVYEYAPGWHMVSKHSGIQPAITWQEYASGVYTQPRADRGLFYWGW